MLWTYCTRTGTINTEKILNLVWSIQPLYSCLYSLPNNKYSPNSDPESRFGLIRFIWFINTSQQVAKPQNYNLLHYSTCVRVPPPWCYSNASKTQTHDGRVQRSKWNAESLHSSTRSMSMIDSRSSAEVGLRFEDFIILSRFYLDFINFMALDAFAATIASRYVIIS